MHGRKLLTTGTVATIAILALIVGCKEATTGPTSVKPQDFASNLKLLSGNQQVGVVGAALPELLSVKVVDAGGQPVPGATVLWQVRDGGGTINPAASTTGASGVAAVTWTLGTGLVANKAVAILQGNYVLDSAVFTANAKTGPPGQFARVSGDAQTARVTAVLPLPLTVNVKDQFGHPVSGAKVTWAAGLFSGSVAAATDTTDATGNASANWTLGTSVTSQSASASVIGLTAVSFSATATPDTSRVLTTAVSPAATAAIGASAGTVTVKVADRFGNLIVGDTVSFADSIGGGLVSPRFAATNASGLASATWTLGPRVGTDSMSARLNGRPEMLILSSVATVQFSDVVAGNFHVCALSTNAKVYCWGLNDVGQLGRGNNRSTTSPTTAAALTADSSATANLLYARQLSGSRSAICAVTLANQLYCWGKPWGNVAGGSLPLLSTINAAAGAGTPLSIANLQVAEDHACLIQTSGVSNCTGNNDHGQLGDVSLGPPFASPSAGTWPWVDVQKTFSVIRLGTSFTCGFHRYLSEGTATVPDSSQLPLCWGDGTEGQRGDSTSLNGAAETPSTPKHIKVKSLTDSIRFDSLSLAVGEKHACAIAVYPAAEVGNAYCWGLNAHGQLGRVTTGGNAARDSVAAVVTGGVAFVRLYAGKYHTCGLASDGTAYCWGRNDYGQLGDGNRMPYNSGSWTPVAVSTGYRFRSLSLGELSTCGVTGTPGTVTGPSASPGTVVCWGDNSFGQIGNGTATVNVPVLAPTKVFGQP